MGFFGSYNCFKWLNLQLNFMNLKDNLHFFIKNDIMNVSYSDKTGIFQLELTNGTWRDATDEEILDVKRAILKTEINNYKLYLETLGAPILFPDGPGTIQTRDEKDFRNINGQATFANILKVNGETSKCLWFIDQNNVKHNLTPQEMIDVAIQVQIFVANIADKARLLKDSIDNLSDMELDSYNVVEAWG